MLISDKKWDAIVHETQAEIERWNAHAGDKNCVDTFHCDVKTTSTYVRVDNGAQGWRDAVRAESDRARARNRRTPVD